MSAPRHDCAAVDAAFDELWRNLAALADAKDERSEGVSDPQRGRAFLAHVAPEAVHRQDVEAVLERATNPPGSHRGLITSTGQYTTSRNLKEIGASMIAMLAIARAIGGLETAAAGLCISCGLGSTRRYCDECASLLAVEDYENPTHTGTSA